MRRESLRRNALYRVSVTDNRAIIPDASHAALAHLTVLTILERMAARQQAFLSLKLRELMLKRSPGQAIPLAISCSPTDPPSPGLTLTGVYHIGNKHRACWMLSSPGPRGPSIPSGCLLIYFSFQALRTSQEFFNSMVSAPRWCLH